MAKGEITKGEKKLVVVSYTHRLNSYLSNDNQYKLIKANFVRTGFEFTEFLESRVNDGSLQLKDLVIALCGKNGWDRFSIAYVNPETNADGFDEWLIEHDIEYHWTAFVIIETYGSFIFVPIDNDIAGSDLVDVLIAIFDNVINKDTDEHNEKKGMCDTKPTETPVNKKSFNSIIEPMFMKL